MARSGNELWLESQGQAICARRERGDETVLTPGERLIEILRLVSRSMRSTGDLAAARACDPAFLVTGRMIASDLALPHAAAVFSGTEAGLERQFFDLFDDLCAELREYQAAG